MSREYNFEVIYDAAKEPTYLLQRVLETAIEVLEQEKWNVEQWADDPASSEEAEDLKFIKEHLAKYNDALEKVKKMKTTVTKLSDFPSISKVLASHGSYKAEVDLSIIGTHPEIPDEWEIVTRTVKVLWNTDIEEKEYGIKGIDITVPDQKIEVTINDPEYTEEKEIVLDLQGVVVNSDSNYELGSGIFPKELEYYEGKWKLNF